MDAFLYKYGFGQGINERKKWFTKEGRLAQTAVSMLWAEEGEPLILCPDKETLLKRIQHSSCMVPIDYFGKCLFLLKTCKDKV